MFGERPKKITAPLEKGDHPELDLSDFCNEDDIAKYQSLIGALQWTISLCRFDIAAAIMTMGRFRAAPRVGHLDRLKRICGYLYDKPNAAIRFRTHMMDHSQHLDNVIDHDWMYSVYGNVTEELPRNMPTPKGKPVQTTTLWMPI